MAGKRRPRSRVQYNDARAQSAPCLAFAQVSSLLSSHAEDATMSYKPPCTRHDRALG
jgi:hypothetical protein